MYYPLFSSVAYAKRQGRVRVRVRLFKELLCGSVIDVENWREMYTYVSRYTSRYPLVGMYPAIPTSS